MKKISTLAVTAALLCGMAVPAFAADPAAAAAGNGVRTQDADRTPAQNWNQATAPMRNGFGMRNNVPDIDGVRANNVNGVRTDNTMRATAAADNDVDWGWLGLAGLIGLFGLRGRERERSK